MSLKLHVFPPSPRAFKVLAVAAHLRLDYELCIVDFAKGMHRSPEFTALNPNQRMPVMEDGDFALWESNAITQYLAAKRPESGLLPADPRQRALVNQWQFWDMAHWDAACSTYIFENHVKALFNRGEPNLTRVAEAEERFRRIAPVLDNHLENRTFILGDTLTVADFTIGAALNLAKAAKIPAESYSNIVRWHRTLAELPGWRKSLIAPAEPL
jgi:glutathione S-transferase